MFENFPQKPHERTRPPPEGALFASSVKQVFAKEAWSNKYHGGNTRPRTSGPALRRSDRVAHVLVWSQSCNGLRGLTTVARPPWPDK